MSLLLLFSGVADARGSVAAGFALAGPSATAVLSAGPYAVAGAAVQGATATGSSA